MATLSQLTAACRTCRRPIFPRVHPLNRSLFCNECQHGDSNWELNLGIARPISLTRSVSLCGKEPVLGDLVLAAMTGKGHGTVAWLSAMIGELVNNQERQQNALALLLSDLEQLGHIEISLDRRNWWVRPTLWLPDRVHKVAGGNAIFSIGARDSKFWNQLTQHLRIEQIKVSRPTKVLKPSFEPYDWVSELSSKLPRLDNWISIQPEIEPRNDGQSPLVLTINGSREKRPISETDILTWRNTEGFKVYAVPHFGGFRSVPRGVARIFKAGGLPYTFQKRKIAFPRDMQPPMPYRKLLTLCSGLLPFEVEDSAGQTWQVFDGIDDLVFQAISATLPLKELL
jgi:hypothetical protein